MEQAFSPSFEQWFAYELPFQQPTKKKMNAKKFLPSGRKEMLSA